MIIAIIPQSLVLTLGLFTAQILSASLAARYTGRFEWPESLMIGLGMLGRAELAFVVMDIAYIQNDILNDEAFYTLMATAFWLNVSVPVTITSSNLITTAQCGTRRDPGVQAPRPPLSERFPADRALVQLYGE